MGSKVLGHRTRRKRKRLLHESNFHLFHPYLNDNFELYLWGSIACSITHVKLCDNRFWDFGV